jgi:hypothetical protein
VLKPGRASIVGEHLPSSNESLAIAARHMLSCHGLSIE